jgi:hypothetical protein
MLNEVKHLARTVGLLTLATPSEMLHFVQHDDRLPW